MPTSYATLFRNAPDALVFGAVVMALSNVGQTYFIALFNPGFAEGVGVGIGTLGLLHAIGTLATAALMPWVGAAIDRVPLRTYTWAVSIALALGCAAVGVAGHVVVLGLGFALLRLAGMGLMVHVASIHATRAFPVDAGKAYGVFVLGYTLVQGLLPIGAVLASDAIGWRASWLACAGLVVAATAVAVRWLGPEGSVPPPRPETRTDQGGAAPAGRGARTLVMALATPAFLVVTFALTAVTFHIGAIAASKGWSMTLIATGYAVFALAHAMGSVGIGPIVDRFGAVRFLAIALLPQAGAFVLLIALDAPWVVFAMLALFAVSAAIDATLRTVIWVELYAPDEIATARSRFEAARIVATAISPAAFGFALQAGVDLVALLLGLFWLTLAAVASGLAAILVARRAAVDARSE